MEEIKNSPQVYTNQVGIEEIKKNPRVYTIQEGIEDIKSNLLNTYCPKGYRRDEKLTLKYTPPGRV